MADRLRVLVACEHSGRVRDAFTALGHDATSCDMLPSDTPGQHHRGDVRELLGEGWDLMVAHPPCTYLCRSGERWLYAPDDANPAALKGGPRRAAMHEAIGFFLTLLHAPIARVAVENPIPHQHARPHIGSPTQVIQPWEYGHPETKATGLWLRGLPPLLVADVVTGRAGHVHRLPPSRDRGRLRSLTYPGVAAAMAEQWG